MAVTWQLWERMKNDEFDLYLSEITLFEIAGCSSPKRELLSSYLADIHYTRLDDSAEVRFLANVYLQAGLLRSRSIADSFHLAFTSVYDLDILLSWNFKDLVNYRTISGVKSINSINNYRDIFIYPPTML